jgi:hypothetical protein
MGEYIYPLVCERGIFVDVGNDSCSLLFCKGAWWWLVDDDLFGLAFPLFAAGSSDLYKIPISSSRLAIIFYFKLILRSLPPSNSPFPRVLPLLTPWSSNEMCRECNLFLLQV